MSEDLNAEPVRVRRDEHEDLIHEARYWRRKYEHNMVDSSILVGLLLRQLGGSAEITHAELAAADGTITRYDYPTKDRFRLEVSDA